MTVVNVAQSRPVVGPVVRPQLLQADRAFCEAHDGLAAAGWYGALVGYPFVDGGRRDA
jgi:hypothetical protein